MQVKNCPDYVACKNEMRESFGVIPLSNLRKYEGPETTNQPICNPLELHKSVKQFGCPNFLGARIPVVSNLKIDRWKFHLSDYWDTQLLDLLEFGFPLNFDTNTVLTTRQTIVDLCWPKGQSVNAAVQKDRYLGSDFILNYPSVDDIVKRVIELRPGSLLCKLDFSWAFRQ